ncbi:MAG: hypothetical protein HY791_38810 [Deltaproteobacteria bacterium]|nr:hypothetical protein [Deltaproteobacteria bacterium]
MLTRGWIWLSVLTLAAGCADDRCQSPQDCNAESEICSDGKCTTKPTGGVPPGPSDLDARPRYYLDARPDTGTSTASDTGTSTTSDGGLDGGVSDGPTDASDAGRRDTGGLDAADAGPVDAASAPMGYAVAGVIAGSSDNFARASFHDETPARYVRSTFSDSSSSCELLDVTSSGVETASYDSSRVRVTGLGNSTFRSMLLNRSRPGEYATGPAGFVDLLDPSMEVTLEVDALANGLSAGRISGLPPPRFQLVSPTIGQLYVLRTAVPLQWLTTGNGSRKVFVDFFDELESALLRCETSDDQGALGLRVPADALTAWEAAVDPFSFSRFVEVGYEERVAGSIGIPMSRMMPVIFVLRQGARLVVQ